MASPNHTQVMINKNVNRMLDEIRDKRKAEGHYSNTKASILHELIMKQHAKECKK